MDKKVLILGGSYFIGFNIVNCFLKDGYHVTTLNRGTKKPAYCGSLNYIYCDRKNEKEMRRNLESRKFDYVIDFSAYSIEDARNVYHALDRSNLKQYIFISSSAVYCPSKSLPLKEDAEKGENPYWGDYGTNKLEIEAFLLQANQSEKFPALILRPPYIYGIHNNIYREAFVFDRILSNCPIIVPNNGETRVQFIHTTDLYKTIVSLFDKQNVTGQAFNVGNTDSISFNEWIALCMDACNKSIEIKYFEYQNTEYTCRDFFPFHDYEYYLDVEKIGNYYKPAISMRDGLKEAFDWYRCNRNAVNKKPHYDINIENILSNYLKENI